MTGRLQINNLVNNHHVLVSWKKFYLSILPRSCSAVEVDNIINIFTGYFSDSDQYRVCLESHQDGSYHIHMLLLYHRTQVINNEQHFDIEGYHLNICWVPLTKRDLEHTLNYIKKHGQYWGALENHHHLSSSDIYMEAMVVSTVQEAQSIIQQNALHDYFKSHINIKTVLTWLFPSPQPKPFQLPFEKFVVPRVLSDWWSIGVYQPRSLTLVLWGPSRLGKMQWARSLDQHDYMKGNINPEGFTSDCQYQVFDDLKEFKKQDWRGLIGGDPFMITGKYIKPCVIMPKSTIMISNWLPLVDQNTIDWWISNLYMIIGFQFSGLFSSLI